jgi:hypothetical protein
MLQFDHVPFGIGDVDELDSARARDFYRDKFTDSSSAYCNDRIPRCINVVNGKGNVGKPRTIERSRLRLLGMVVLEHFKRWTLVAATGQLQVHATNPRAWNPCGILQPFA